MSLEAVPWRGEGPEPRSGEKNLETGRETAQWKVEKPARATSGQHLGGHAWGCGF